MHAQTVYFVRQVSETERECGFWGLLCIIQVTGVRAVTDPHPFKIIHQVKLPRLNIRLSGRNNKWGLEEQRMITV